MQTTNREHVKQILNQQPEWKILDVGCGNKAGWPQATTLLDVKDYSASYPGKQFIQASVENPLPFEDNTFDFVIASHVLEHVKDPSLFCSEMSRIARAGYIEVPSPLFDNLGSADDSRIEHGHKWWVTFDGSTKKIILKKKKYLLNQVLPIETLAILIAFFRTSMVTEVFWEGDVNFEIRDCTYSGSNKTYDLSQENTVIRIRNLLEATRVL